MAEQIRVRFAPSPTGFLHIGGARTALFNWLFTRHHGGRFILRIEDTDQSRSTQLAVEKIVEDLKWLGLDWDEGPEKGGEFGPYFQMERLDGYRKYSDELIREGKAYYCYCSHEELAQRRKEALKKGASPGYAGKCRELSSSQIEEWESAGREKVVRFKTPPAGVTEVNDLIRGKVEFENALLDDFVIMKSTRTPAFNFANVVDDHLMEITHVLRGDEHLSNTPRQVLLYQALGFRPPAFGHLAMILGTDRAKLSKREGAVSLSWYREEGYLPQALVNYLALLGWATPDSQQLFSSPEEIIRKFSLEGIGKPAAIFDRKKLEWMNGEYMKRLPPTEITELVKPYLEKAGLLRGDEDEERLRKIAVLEQDRIKILSRIIEYGDFFFLPEIEYDEKATNVLQKEGALDLLRIYRDRLRDLDPFSVEKVEEVARQIIAEEKIKGGALIHPTRAALTGRTVGPGLFELMALLGKEMVGKRLDKAREEKP